MTAQRQILSLCLLLFGISTTFSQTTINQLIGSNVDARDPIDRVTRFSFVRNYHDFGKDTGFPGNGAEISCPPEFQLSWNPSNDGSDFYSFDEFYDEMSGRISPSLKGSHPSMYGYNYFPDPKFLEMKPICTPQLDGLQVPLNQVPGTNYLNAIPDATNPAIYISVSKWITLYAARYGRTSYPAGDTYVDDFIIPNLAPGESVATGLEYATFVEPNNEPDKTWWDNSADVLAQVQNPSDAIAYWYFAPEQYAALVSASYDGHGRSPAFEIPGLTGAAQYYGVKNADAQMSYVLAGLAEMRGAYIERMIDWFVLNRQNGVYGFQNGDVIPFDVINFHHYSTENSDLINNSTDFKNIVYDDLISTVVDISENAVSPEDDMLKEKIGWFIDFLDDDHANFVQGKEIWFTEVGYDSENSTVETSGVNVPNFGDICRLGQNVQRDWLVRSILESSAAIGGTSPRGIDKLTVFNLTNDQTLGTNSYSSSGLLDDNNNPKKSWYSLMTLKHVIGSHTFASESPALTTVSAPGNNTGVAPRIYKYNGANPVYAIWSPTSNGASYSADVTFNFEQFPDAHYVKFKDLSEVGEKVSLAGQINGNTIMDLPISEAPIFVVLGPGYTPHWIGVTTMDPSFYNVESLCCNSVRLSYRSVNDSPYFLPTRNRVYYAKKTEMHQALQAFGDMNPADDWNSFDLGLTINYINSGNGNETTQVIKLHSENAGSTSTVIHGLEPGEDYWFWVIPVDLFGNITVNFDHCDPDNQLENLWTEGSANGCMTFDCLIDIDPTWVTTSYAAGSMNETNVLTSLIGGQSEDCGALGENEILPEPLYWDYAPGAENWFVIEFPESYRIENVFWNDGFGMGEMKVEYQVCDCDEWEDWETLVTNGYHEWRILEAARRRVHKIRFTKLQDQARIPRIYFCGTEYECYNRYAAELSFDPPSQVDVLGVTQNTANLTWIPGVEKLTSKESEEPGEILDGYEVFYERKEAFDHVTIENNIKLDAQSTTAEIIGLEPGTEYTAAIKIIKPWPCFYAVSQGLVSPPIGFITESESAQFKLSDPDQSIEEPKLLEIDIRPNPSIEAVTITFMGESFKEIEIYDSNGKLYFQQKIQSDEKYITLENVRESLGSGIFFVKCTSINNETITEKMVVLK